MQPTNQPLHAQTETQSSQICRHRNRHAYLARKTETLITRLDDFTPKHEPMYSLQNTTNQPRVCQQTVMFRTRG